MPNRRFCKICDVRDYKTAEACAFLGVDYLGLHCIDGVKPERKMEFQRIANDLPLAFPDTAPVIVTRITDSAQLLAILQEIPARFIQLHHAYWTCDSIRKFRDLLATDPLTREVKIVGVATPSDVRRARDLCEVSSLVVIDRTYYGEGGTTPRIPPREYAPAVASIRDTGVPCLVAGGLNPYNAAEYLDVTGADGIDVQTGVERNGRRGIKDLDAIAQLMTSIRLTY